MYDCVSSGVRLRNVHVSNSVRTEIGKLVQVSEAIIANHTLQSVDGVFLEFLQRYLCCRRQDVEIQTVWVRLLFPQCLAELSLIRVDDISSFRINSWELAFEHGFLVVVVTRCGCSYECFQVVNWNSRKTRLYASASWLTNPQWITRRARPGQAMPFEAFSLHVHNLLHQYTSPSYLSDSNYWDARFYSYPGVFDLRPALSCQCLFVPKTRLRQKSFSKKCILSST